MYLRNGYPDSQPDPQSLPDRWILSRTQAVTRTVADALDGYRFNEAAGTLYQFVWHEFCDWYLEAIKPALYGNQGEQKQASTQKVLWRVIKDILILLHPFVPFVTEEIWHKLPGTEGSIMRAAFPSFSDGSFESLEAEQEMDLIIGVITGIRNIRGEMNLAPSMNLEVTVQAEAESTREIIDRYQELVIHLARLKSLSIELPGERPKTAATAVVKDVTLFASLEGIIDFAKERQRLTKEIAKVDQELAGVSKKLNNENFLSKAPADIVAKVKDKHAGLEEKKQKIEANLDRIQELEQ
jgi:valyl-tRNA synthetase